MDSAAMVSAVQSGGVDASNAAVLELLNEVYTAAVAGGKWRVSEYSLGNTTAGTASYALPAEVVDVEGLKVGAQPYRRVSTRTVWDLTNSDSFLGSAVGVFAPDFDSSGGSLVALYPVPGDVAAIVALAALEPVALTGLGGNNTILPVDLESRLVDAAINLGKARLNGDLAAGQAAGQGQKDLSDELRRRRNSRVGTGGEIDMSAL